MDLENNNKLNHKLAGGNKNYRLIQTSMIKKTDKYNAELFYLKLDKQLTQQ